jgi:phosphocarrier protein HPr
MPSRDVEIVNRLGMHLRAAAAFVKMAEGFACSVHVVKDGQRANGKSILSLLSLGAPQGDHIKVETKGEGAEEALAALAGFVAGRFGEPE